MKNFTSLFVAAFAFALSANAQGLVPEDIEIANPSFELANEALGDDVKAHLVGWEVDGPNKNDWAPRAHTNSAFEGDWYVRMVLSSGNIEPGTLIRQYVETGKGPGVYVLTAACNVSRNAWRGNIDALDNVFGGLWIVDDDDAPEDVEGRGFCKIGECLGDWKPQTIVYKSEVDQPFLEIGFGIPSASKGNPKGILQCDAFKLQYFNTDDVEAVKAYLNGESGIDDIYVAPEVKDNKYYNLQGMEVAEPTTGLYIHNGKKVFIKK
ncbi:hypothetical protein [uncultured Muribaculum sp.]|uniref:hypothetical protein n=1 Tax=uncultured Muribaculum sp. TaxID=1918613 RepID=UPI0025B084CB|nr:hypothetical protein [uncultured Muribaculum sp.]